MNIDLTALITAHERLTFAAQTQPVLDAILQAAAAHAMSFSDCSAISTDANQACLFVRYDEAGKRVRFSCETYRRRGGVGVRIKAWICGTYCRDKKIHDARGPLAESVDAALSSLLAGCKNYLEEQAQRKCVIAALEAAGFKELHAATLYRPGAVYQKGGVRFCESDDRNGWSMYFSGSEDKLANITRVCQALSD